MKKVQRVWSKWLNTGQVDKGIEVLEGYSLDRIDSDEIHLGLGILHMKQGRSKRSEGLFNTALEMAKENENNWIAATCLSMLSRICADRGEIDLALSFADDAWNESSKNSLPYGEALALHARAYCRRLSGDFDGAIEEYKAAIQIYRNEGDYDAEREECRNLATALFLKGEIDEATKLLKGLEGKIFPGMPYFEAYSHIDKAILSFVEGRFDVARNEIEEARGAIGACEQKLDPDEEMIIDFIIDGMSQEY
jgi:tetratricopeptide (TPR) repeat protein